MVRDTNPLRVKLQIRLLPTGRFLVFENSPRHLRNPTPEGVRYTREELKAIAKADVDAIMAEKARSSFCNPAAPAPAAPGSFCEKPKFIPRNAQCPCGSGTKYKRCCGVNAPPVLNRAA